MSSVARTDPDTGEKANKLRKSYEGQIKSAALSGRNRPYREPRADDEPSKLMKMATISEEAFKATQHHHKVGDLDSLRGILSNALRLNSGTMPKKIEAEWDDVLGHEVKKPASQPQLNPASIKSQQQKPINGIANQYLAPPANKMETRKKKRAYTDDAYQGYAEGISDVDNASDGDRDYNDRDRKRRRKD